MYHCLWKHNKKKHKIDVVASTNEFHEKVIKIFITALAEISKVFDLSELPVIQALLPLDPKSYSDNESEEFQTYETIL